MPHAPHRRAKEDRKAKIMALVDTHEGARQRRSTEVRRFAQQAAQRDPDPVEALDSEYDIDPIASLMIELDDDHRFF
ncbi:hypothetical protein HLB44_34890 [Aquincola sp. S2]|uniref:Uncharacterized protein n=1 Tax=Pseudaquabacterium terrae TaxID=2732868 RepID=A0ABX2ETY7_9BURK|nr:hypothetical protein [Aquabacterium terrae]NRF72184.1 hypothetical protein [Aquabacterium terrae]